MKILIVNTFYYPNMQGGAEQSVKLLAEGLANIGNEVAIFCVDSKEKERKIEKYNNVTVYRYNAHKFDLYKFSYNKDKVGKIEKIMQKLLCYYNKESVNDFRKLCNEFKPDVIHTNSTYGVSPFIWKKAYKLNIPVVHTIRDISIISPVEYGHKCNKLIKKLHVLYMKYISKFVTAVAAPSEYTLNTSLAVKTFKKVKAKVCIFNSVEINYEQMKKLIAEKEKRNSKIIKFMYAGRLVQTKGVENLLKVFKKIKNKNCELHICGDGILRDYVKDCAKEDNRIIFHGKLNNDELGQCYDDCDVLIVPSCWPEPFGRVLIEGNLHGLPVIATNCGGMPEIIHNTKAGVIYDYENEKEFQNAIIHFEDRKIIKSYFNNMEENIGIYDISIQIKKYNELYKFIKGGK